MLIIPGTQTYWKCIILSECLCSKMSHSHITIVREKYMFQLNIKQSIYTGQNSFQWKTDFLIFESDYLIKCLMIIGIPLLKIP